MYCLYICLCVYNFKYIKGLASVSNNNIFQMFLSDFTVLSKFLFISGNKHQVFLFFKIHVRHIEKKVQSVIVVCHLYNNNRK